MDLRENLEPIIHCAVAMNRRRLLCQASDWRRKLCQGSLQRLQRLWLPEEMSAKGEPTSTHHQYTPMKDDGLLAFFLSFFFLPTY
jgi:hypothetical protein